VTEITVEVWGGGGGGGTGATGKGGGGGGAYARTVIPVTPLTTYNYTVGSGGTPGNDGGDSFFDTGTQVLARGGGAGSSNSGGGGGNAATSTGTVVFGGGNGGNGTNSGFSRAGGGGGGSAFSISVGSNGTNASGNTPGSGGTGSGDGGDGATSANTGSNGLVPGGGGGGGGRTGTSGNGADGRIIISYELNSPTDPDLQNSTIAVQDGVLPADGVSTTVITVTLRNINGDILIFGGETVTLTTTQGSIGSVTDNSDGTYTAVFTTTSTPATAVINAEVNGDPLNAQSFILITNDPIVQRYYPGGLDQTSLVMWLDAADQSTVQLNSGNVSQWTDLSSQQNSAIQVNASIQPEFVLNAQNGRPVLRYSSGDRLTTTFTPTAADLGSGASVSIAVRTTDSDVRSYFGSWGAPRLYLQNRSGVLQTGFGSGWVNSGTFPEDQFIISGLYATSSEGTGRIDGEQVHNYAATFTGTNSNLIGIGFTSGLSPDRPFIGDIGEIVFYQSALSLTARLILENYLSTKWDTPLDNTIDRFSSSSGFDHQLAGIGRLTGSDFVSETVYSSGGLGLNSTSAAGNYLASDNHFLLAAHNNLNGINQNFIVDPTEGLIDRWSRVWYLDKTNPSGDGTVTVYFDWQDYAVPAPDPEYTFILLYHPSDPSMPTGSTVFVDESSIISGNRILFTLNSSDLADGFYTLGIRTGPPIFYSRSDGNWNDGNTWSLLGHSGAAIGSTPGTTATVFIGSSHQVTLTANETVNGTLEVNTDGILATGAFNLSGTGSVTIASDGGLHIGSASGITLSASTGAIQTSTRNYHPDATYRYTGVVAQQTGDGLPSEPFNVQVAVGETLTASASYRVRGTLSLISGQFLITNGLSLIADTQNISGGELRYQLIMDGQRGYRQLASPLLVSYDNFLSGILTQGFTGASLAGSQQPNVLWYDETFEGTVTQRWRAPAAASDLITPGRGYMVYLFGDAPDDSRYNDPLPYTLDVNGQENTAAMSGFDFDITYTSTGDQGWNLIGNPFGAALDWEHPSWSKTNVSPNIYVWNPNTNQYDAWNGTTGDIMDGILAPFQAFWIEATDNSPELIAQRSALTMGGSFIGKQQRQPPPVFALKAIFSDSLYSTAYLSFNQDGSADTDAYDAERLITTSDIGSFLELYSRNPSGKRLAINNVPAYFDTSLRIPFEINAYQDFRPLTGSVTLVADNLSAIPSDWQIRIIDATGKEYPIEQSGDSLRIELPLRSSDNRRFFTTAHVGKTTRLPAHHYRFYLDIYSENSLSSLPTEISLSRAYPNPFNPSTTITVNLPSQQPIQLEVFDIMGRLVEVLATGQKSGGSHEFTWNARTQASGVYVFRLMTDSGVHTRKVTLVK